MWVAGTGSAREKGDEVRGKVSTQVGGESKAAGNFNN